MENGGPRTTNDEFRAVLKIHFRNAWRAELLRRRSGWFLCGCRDQPPTPASQELRPPIGHVIAAASNAEPGNSPAALLRQRIEVSLDRVVIAGRHLLLLDRLGHALLHLPHGVAILLAAGAALADLARLPLEQKFAAAELAVRFLGLERGLRRVVFGPLRAAAPARSHSRLGTQSRALAEAAHLLGEKQRVGVHAC